MKRLTSTVTLAAMFAVAGVAAAVPAHAAVTNPADNPVPITVTGDDGNTYVDGQDTLPGFDDLARTYIPGAWFDFAGDRAHHADGQSIPWTEWDRATGYEAWLAAQSAPPSGGATTPANASTTSQKSGTGAAAGTASGAGATPTASPTTSADPSEAPTALADGASPTASASTSDVVLGASDSGPGGGSSTSIAGLAILGVLFGLGGLAFGLYTFFRPRLSSKESLS
jgi:hypothetical protein